MRRHPQAEPAGSPPEAPKLSTEAVDKSVSQWPLEVAISAGDCIFVNLAKN
jgi:hypothetical protein